MAIFAALITASVAILVPFITFYLNRAPAVVGVGPATHLDVPITISPSAKLLIVIPIALVFSVPVGFLSFCVAVVANLFFAPTDNIFLFSLDAGLCSAAIFAMSLIWHAGFNEPRKWWDGLKWYQPMMVSFFGALGFIIALFGNTIWAFAMGINPMDVWVFHDSADAAIGCAVVSWLAAYGVVKVEELREAPRAA
jgi:hypothetical protein